MSRGFAKVFWIFLIILGRATQLETAKDEANKKNESKGFPKSEGRSGYPKGTHHRIPKEHHQPSVEAEEPKGEGKDEDEGEDEDATAVIIVGVSKELVHRFFTSLSFDVYIIPYYWYFVNRFLKFNL